MKVVRLLVLASMVGLCAWAAWPQSAFDAHAAARMNGIRTKLRAAHDPIIVFGDSIVELSTLPPSICGHRVINAGISGLSTATALRIKLRAVIEKPAALIVFAMGVNDAAIPTAPGSFRQNYKTLLEDLTPLARHRAIAAITPIESGLPEARKVDAASLDAYNAAIPELARQTRSALIPMPSMPLRHTIDGVHLGAAGYAVWTSAITGGISAIVCNTRPADVRS